MRKSIVLWLLIVPALTVLVAGCGSRDLKGRIVFKMSLTGLPVLPPQHGVYEGWAIVGNEPRSTGKFRIDPATNPASVTNPDGSVVYGTVVEATFGPSVTQLGSDFPFIVDANAFFITVEPEMDKDGLPSGNVVLAGPIVGHHADLTQTGLKATGGPGLGDLTLSTGLAVVTQATGAPAQPQNGVWFTTNATGATPGLSLPTLPGNWTYEAWLSDGTSSWSMGKFRDTAAPDDDARTTLTRGLSSIGFRAPGQDFAQPTVIGATTVLHLATGTYRAEVTVEPDADDDLGAFPLTILSEPIPTTAVTAAKVTAAEITMTSQTAQLPSLAATVNPLSVAFQSTASLPSLGAARNGHYEAFGVVAGTPQSIGTFVIDGTTQQVTSIDGLTIIGTASSFQLDPSTSGLGLGFPNLAAATEVFVSVEPQGDPDPAPSASVIVAGGITAGQATLNVAGLTAAGGRGIADLTTVIGRFILRTPTNDANGVLPDDDQGIWFRRLGADVNSLVLPALATGWTYEGWVVDTGSGQRWSTGRFRNPNAVDDDAMTWAGRGATNTGFTVPGQDFIVAASGTTVPVIDATAGTSVFITVEPVPDTDTAPFSLRILQAAVPPSVALPFGLSNSTPSFTGTIDFDP